MRSIETGKKLSKKLNTLVMENKSYANDLLYRATELATNILSTSKGRNKVCSVIQYHAKIVYQCHIYSNIPEVSELMM